MNNRVPPGMDSDQVFYSAHFMDLAIWEPLVLQVCRQHGLGCRSIDPGVPGTFPTFIVELDSEINQTTPQAVVVKFFGSLFNGPGSFCVEKEIGQWLSQQSLLIHSPAILVADQLDQAWSYLIFERVEGVSIRQFRQSLSDHAWGVVAEQMGVFTKALHTISAVSMPGIVKLSGDSSWSDFVDFLERQRAGCIANHHQWADLPGQLLSQIQDFLLPIEDLLDLSSTPHLIHADLTGDHLLGRLTTDADLHPFAAFSSLPPRGEWENLAIIDWGDARLGNILYELVALSMDLFLADKRLLKIYIDAYGLPDFYCQDFARKALCMVLLHQFPIPAQVYAPYLHAQNLNELAQGIFGVQI
jgi:hypothetical protein